MAAGPLTVTEERSAVVAFTDPFLEFRYTAIIKKPRKRKMRIKTAEQLLDSYLPYGVEEGSISQVDVYSLINYGNFTFDLQWYALSAPVHIHNVYIVHTNNLLTNIRFLSFLWKWLESSG